MSGPTGEAAQVDGRSAADLAAHEDAIRLAAASLIASHDRVALLYSGGAESGLLLHLLRPLRAQMTVLWVNPGALPHEAEHIRREAAGGPFVEVPGERAAFWRRHGLPAAVVPSHRMTAFAGDAPMDGPPLVPMAACCIGVRTSPGRAWAAANGVGLLIHGQRRGEGSGMFTPGAIGAATWAPLARWSRPDVMRRVAHHAVPLPRQYAEGFPESFECDVCPANLKPGRLAFLRQHYPAQHAETLRLAGAVLREVGEAVEAERDALAAAEAPP